MKRYISNHNDIYERITDETADYYICGNKLFSKKDIIDCHPLDSIPQGKLVIHTVQFLNY